MLICTQGASWRRIGLALLAILLAAMLAACGGGGQEPPLPPENGGPGNDQPEPVPPTALGPVDPDLLLLLVPDTLALGDARVGAWLDAASEVGARMRPVTATEFLALGTEDALRYGGLVLPDTIHNLAGDALVEAIRGYTQAGGRTMLVYDFAALVESAAGEPTYPIPASRLSDLAGVDYILYDKYLDQVAGLGPVVGPVGTLRELLVPPGKSVPYPPSDDDAAPLLDALGLAPGEALYVPVSTDDPGGVRAFDPQQYSEPSQPSRSLPKARSAALAFRQPGPRIDLGRTIRAPAPAAASRLAPQAAPSARPIVLKAGVDAADASAEHAYSGYLRGPLAYHSYVTEGDYSGTVLTRSPQFGLVAGVHAFGAGKVLFVNTPLTYLKGRTDALPMHGYLNYFVRHVLKASRLSSMPDGVAGLVFNWHHDSMDAQEPMLALERRGVYDHGPFSIHMTAGPDAIEPGDGLGFDLRANPVAQQFLQRMVAKGHAVGSHGGWIHDYYGLRANEENEADFLQYLEWNREAVDAAIGRPSRDYSAPQGNNPVWAMQWLEQQGVVAAYFAGHTGLGVTRHYRDNQLLTPSLWVVPVTPFGNYATFEEFSEFNLPAQEVTDWYRALADFSVAQNTVRMVYAHPPGALEWVDVLEDLLAYVHDQGTRHLRWYTMERLADFMTARSDVEWSETLLVDGTQRLTATHPDRLDGMVWLLPRDRYAEPVELAGATLSNDGSHWIVKANPGARALSLRLELLAP
ncbi:MAG TPA: polysaccharide deacetylase family protein [Ottowia sp.]|uniref:polysaccharide deacetylase family protein n=1 Tax=Ottowia sp. TaxID=1898956 RepID=UPI002B8940A6|nr:polysaccharide deacetylase family protein [Ottowia sp.]HMN22161.1 polysaccharide deacetylase family protein [Ottowia sp.]